MKKWNNWLAWTACMGMLCQSALLGETDVSSNSRAEIRDVALGAHNTLAGQVVDAQGKGIAHAEVNISANSQSSQTTTTDEFGNFQMAGLQGGLYQVSCQQHHMLYRAWANNTAPPSATESVMLVQSDTVERGQCGDGCETGACGPGYDCGPGGYVPGPTAGNGMLGLLANPWVVGAAVAVAIAVPLALDDNAS